MNLLLCQNTEVDKFCITFKLVRNLFITINIKKKRCGDINNI